MSLSSIMSSSLSALQANQVALRATSNNVANVNTEGYTRVEANFTSRSSSGGVYGVDVDLDRVANKYLAAAEMRAASTYASAEVRSDILDRAQALLGDPSQGASVFSKLDSALDAFGTLSVDPSDSLRRADVIASLETLTGQLEQTGSEIQNLRDEADQRLASTAEDANLLMRSISELNEAIQRSRVGGSDATEAETEQSRLLDQLSEIIDIKIEERALGGVNVRSKDGFILVDSAAAQISISDSENPQNYGRLVVQQPHSDTTIDFESHLSDGRLAGLLKARDVDLAELGSAFGEYAAGVVDALNAAHNDASASPAPTTLTGVNTGLLDTDQHGLTGVAHIAIVNTNGELQQNYAVNFSTGEVQDSTGATVANFGANASINAFRTTMNGVFGGAAQIDFSEGRMSIEAIGSNGIVIRQDADTPSDRAGRGFSHTFGLNNVIGRDTPLNSATGLTGAAALGTTAGERMVFELRDDSGGFISRNEITIDATITDVDGLVNAINSEIGAHGVVALDSDGRINFQPTNNREARTLDVVIDTTQRGDTGLSLSQIFVLGDANQSRRAVGLEVRDDISSNLDRLAAAQPDIDGVALNTRVLAAGDGRGATALEAASSRIQSFGAAGALDAQTGTISNYAARLAGIAGSRATSAEASVTAAEALKNEVAGRRDSVEGVNLDEELVKMTQYQQAYSAASRMMQAANELFDTLLRMV